VVMMWLRMVGGGGGTFKVCGDGKCG